MFHAAALKHLPLLEFNPSEAWKTNVVGTHNVLEAAEASASSRLVNVSTDKAADPTSVLGFSKRICERLTAEVADRTGRHYVSVRFGNVLGSKGSVLGMFERQVRDGGPITVTDPDVTRYFMTSEESVALTIQAGAIGEPGEVLVLDMGDAGAHRRDRRPAWPSRRRRSDPDRLHRFASRGEAARGAARRRRGRPPPDASADQPGARAAAALRATPRPLAPSTATSCCRPPRWRSPPSSDWASAEERAVVDHDGGR